MPQGRRTSGGSGTAGASSFTRVSGVYAIPSTAKSLKVVWYSSSMASASILYWGGMQFEAGSSATQLVRNASTIAGELADKEINNPFFQWLRGNDEDARLILKSIESKVENNPGRGTQWAGERTDSEEAWRDSCGHDLDFMRNLLNGIL